MREVDPKFTVAVGTATAVWLNLVMAASAAGLMDTLPSSFLPVAVLSLTGLLFFLFWQWRRFRNWLLEVDLRLLIAVHLLRFMGVCLLALHREGPLPYAFAVTAGWGDLAVACGAVALIARPWLITCARGAILLAWNVLGLAATLGVLVAAAQLAVCHPESMDQFTRFPFSLVPLFLLPLILFTHGVILARSGRLG